MGSQAAAGRLPAAQQADVRAVYQLTGGKPIWTAARLRSLQEVAQGAERHGLPAGDFFDFVGLAADRETAEIFYALNGRKHLVIGNHDLDRHGRLVQAIARLPWASAPTHYAEIKHEGKRIVLSHYAALTWNGSHRGSYLAFGHSHGALPALPRSLDVGVDCHGFRPISVDEFLQLADAEGKEAQRRTELVVAELRKRLIPREPSGKR